MTKINPQKKIQKLRTEQEMRMTLMDFSHLAKKAGIEDPPVDSDDSRVVLNDVIEELLEKRQIIEDIKNTAQSWLPKLARR